MIPPFGCIGHFILAAALLGKFIQVHAFLQLQVISDPVVRIVIAVSVRGDTVCCQENAAAGLGIRNSSRPGTLVILISAINIDDMNKDSFIQQLVRASWLRLVLVLLPVMMAILPATAWAAIGDELDEVIVDGMNYKVLRNTADWEVFRNMVMASANEDDVNVIMGADFTITTMALQIATNRIIPRLLIMALPTLPLQIPVTLIMSIISKKAILLPVLSQATRL